MWWRRFRNCLRLFLGKNKLLPEYEFCQTKRQVINKIIDMEFYRLLLLLLYYYYYYFLL